VKLEVIDIVEDSDGGASVTIDLDEEGKMFLIERGFNNMIRDSIDNLKTEEALGELTRMAQEDGDYDPPTMQERVIEHNRKHKEFLQEYQKWVEDQKYINDQESRKRYESKTN
jgi:hypothetical protein